MKRGDKIEIKKTKCPHQRMAWTETYTGRKTLPAGTKLYHFSYSMISSFCSEHTTCFFFEKKGLEYCYVATLKKDVVVDCFDDDEVRFQISADNVEIHYIGRRIYLGEGKVRDNTKVIREVLK